jgi:IclR family acetate operon transcriptional repressor
MGEGVKSAIRTLRLLEFFAAAEGPTTLKVAAETLSLPKSSASMLIATLVAEGYLEPAGRDGFVLPARLSNGWVGGPVGAVVRAARPEMDRLLELFQETVVLGVPAPSLDVRIVAHRQSPLAVRYDVSRDPVIPGWATAMGHAILSRMPEDVVRAYLRRTPRTPLTACTVTDEDALIERLRTDRIRGHSLNIDERIEGASGAAAPIVDPEGRPRAALNVVTLTPRFQRRRAEITSALGQAAKAVETTLFGAPCAPAMASGD